MGYGPGLLLGLKTWSSVPGRLENPRLEPRLLSLCPSDVLPPEARALRAPISVEIQPGEAEQVDPSASSGQGAMLNSRILNE